MNASHQRVAEELGWLPAFADIPLPLVQRAKPMNHSGCLSSRRLPQSIATAISNTDDMTTHDARLSLSGAVSRVSTIGVVAWSALLLSSCSPRPTDEAVGATPSIQSVYTQLDGGSCKTAIDKSDPNETPYLACPGVAGYSLIVRRVDSGRNSIDIVDPRQRVLPLHYEEFVTRHMSTLGEKAEWRVATKGGGQVPVALIVRVQAREDNRNPEQVTHTYVAVAKITPHEACVTEAIPEGTRSEPEVRSAADAAPGRQCARPQPPMSAEGIVIR